MIEDAELLRQYVKERSDSAFAELVRRHVDLAYSVALRKVGGDAHAAQDVAQAVFIALARQAGALTQRQTLTGWVYLTTHHLAAQTVRADRRRQVREREAHTMNEIFNTPDIDWPKLRPVLDDAMQELNEPDREAVLLRYFERRAFAEIGRALHVTEDAARMRVDRALEKLRALLARRGVASTAAALATVLGSQVAAAPAGLATAITGAVAASAMTGAAATAAGTFMTTANIITSTLALAAIGTAAFSAVSASHRADELAASEQERVALQARLDGAESRLAQAARQSAALQDQINALRATAPALKTPAAVATAGPVPSPEEHEAKASAEAHQREIDRKLASYDPLFKKLGLSGVQVDQFKALLVAKLGREGDLAEYARAQGARPVDPDVRALDGQADAEFAAQVRATFGEATYAALQHFDETGAARELTDQLSSALAPTATPLSADQADQLVEILANNSRTPDGRISSDPRALNFEAAMAQAQGLLSPPQMAALRQSYQNRR